MATLFQETFESGSNGTTITTANSAFTNLVTAGWTFSNAHVPPLYGAMAGKCVAAAGTTIANAGNTAWAAAPVTYWDQAWYVEALPNSNTTVVSVRNVGTLVAELRMTSGGALQVRVNNVQVAISANLAAAGVFIRARFKLDSTNGKVQLQVAAGSANITGGVWDYDSGLVAASGLTATTNFQVGFVTSTTGTLHWGGFAVADNAYPGPAPNQPPTCSASAAPSPAAAGATVTLTGTDSDPDGTIATRAWAQTGGPAVTLTGAATATATFTAPSVAGGTSLTFSYTVTDNTGATATATVTVSVTSSTASVAYRASAQSTNTTAGAATSVTIPGTVVVGDKLLLFFADGGGTLTNTFTAAGWQAISGAVTAQSIGLHGWQKTAVAGDAGSTLTITSSVDGTATYKRTMVVLAYAGARIGGTAAVQETTARTTHTAPAGTAVSGNAWVVNFFADRGSPGSTAFTLPANLTARQSFAHAGGAAITTVVADDDIVGAGTVGANIATGTLSTASAVMATVVLEPGTPNNPPPNVNAGTNQTNVEPYTQVIVGGTDTPQGTATIASTQWTQASGADVTGSFAGAATDHLTITTPGTVYGTSIVLRKTVTDSTGVSASSDVQVDVLPVTERAVSNGSEVPMRMFAVTT